MRANVRTPVTTHRLGLELQRAQQEIDAERDAEAAVANQTVDQAQLAALDDGDRSVSRDALALQRSERTRLERERTRDERDRLERQRLEDERLEQQQLETQRHRIPQRAQERSLLRRSEPQ